MAKPTYEERKSMIGKLYLSDVNQLEEMAVKVLKVFHNAGGFTVMYRYPDSMPVYSALSRFKRRFPHEIRSASHG